MLPVSPLQVWVKMYRKVSSLCGPKSNRWTQISGKPQIRMIWRLSHGTTGEHHPAPPLPGRGRYWPLWRSVTPGYGPFQGRRWAGMPGKGGGCPAFNARQLGKGLELDLRQEEPAVALVAQTSFSWWWHPKPQAGRGTASACHQTGVKVPARQRRACFWSGYSQDTWMSSHLWFGSPARFTRQVHVPLSQVTGVSSNGKCSMPQQGGWGWASENVELSTGNTYCPHPGNLRCVWGTLSYGVLIKLAPEKKASGTWYSSKLYLKKTKKENVTTST